MGFESLVNGRERQAQQTEYSPPGGGRYDFACGPKRGLRRALRLQAP